MISKLFTLKIPFSLTVRRRSQPFHTGAKLSFAPLAIQKRMTVIKTYKNRKSPKVGNKIICTIRNLRGSFRNARKNPNFQKDFYAGTKPEQYADRQTSKLAENFQFAKKYKSRPQAYASQTKVFPLCQMLD